ncbi:hypothetical protein CASFOL_026565 [Castilleja foliolosa]|uniref:KIB1-4 beta-propeller domain-containing protein n=1 Tax=Castilleja foliolosa TaxID=1961234 RepID=A0ABD3CI94_9LAMI
MAFSSSSLLPSICVNGIFKSSSNYCMLGKWSPKSCASSFKLRGLSTATATTAIQAVQNQDSPGGPWLMLPPEYEDGKFCDKNGLGKRTYKFYSLLDNKVETPCFDEVIRDLPLTCRGSSHGWLALLGPQNEGFFLYNPNTRRHIKLPSIFNLPKLPGDDIMGSTSSTTWRDVQKLILTCSPDEDEENCRAVIINGFGHMLAYCCPGRSKEWAMMRDEERGRSYEDCAYSTSRKLLYGLTNSSGLEIWDLKDPSSPKLIKVDKRNSYPSFEVFLWCMCLYREFLVVAGEDLLLVVQHTMDTVGPDGSCFNQLDERPRPDNPCHISSSLGGQPGSREPVNPHEKIPGSATDDAVAIPATRFPDLKPDSIYFTDGYWEGPLDGHDSDDDDDDERVGDEGFSGRDIGIYNYKDKTVSECYYPWDIVKNKLTTPIWFFPSRTI